MKFDTQNPFNQGLAVGIMYTLFALHLMGCFNG